MFKPPKFVRSCYVKLCWRYSVSWLPCTSCSRFSLVSVTWGGGPATILESIKGCVIADCVSQRKEEVEVFYAFAVQKHHVMAFKTHLLRSRHNGCVSLRYSGDVWCFISALQSEKLCFHLELVLWLTGSLCKSLMTLMCYNCKTCMLVRQRTSVIEEAKSRG